MEQLVFLGLDIIGTIAFAASGALAAMRKGLDLLGVIIIGGTTAIGGGVLRDIFLSTIPALLKSDDIYATTAICGALLYALLQFFGLSGSLASIITISAVVIIRLAGQQLWLHMPYSKMDD